MDVKTDIAGGASIKMSDGNGVHLPPIQNAPNVSAPDLRHVTTGLLELIGNLDKRLAALEKQS